ncbi:MAG: ABC transporter permease [Firmicutes bacterium]|nr:ABC transporter permease [Bacillota bacterium]MBQ1524057.1 ABC transporter permease [Bacillota bacterium]MBQ1887494.1 ABC transporter permease [Bacillota bacterium]MBQ2455363.1 ABC transporter permease [Bacillota bacterium]MBQ4181163.1 ABC transporter permease [Bacillota bacterium]
MKIFDKKDYENLDTSKLRLVQMEESIHDAKFETKPVGFFKDAMLRFRKNKSSVVASILIAIIIVFAIFGPMMNDHGFNDQDLNRVNAPPKINALANMGVDLFDGGMSMVNRRVANLADTEQYPEGSILDVYNRRFINGIEMCDLEVDYYLYNHVDDVYWFGTDYLGRDLWTRLWRGARVSLVIALVSVVVNVVIGVTYGSIAGYYGGKIDMVMMRITEVINAFPNIVVMTLFIMIFGTGIMSIILALVVRDWIGTARLIRAQFYRFKENEYVLAARTLGVPDRTLIFRHILPNSIGPIITRTALAVPGAIFSESFLAYIGLGLKPPEPSIGILLSEGQKVLLYYPTQVLFPAILISVLCISFNMFGNGLRDAFDPTQRGA